MSEERLERIEAQISQLSELMMQQNTNMIAMQQNMNEIREDIAVLHQRSDSTQQNMNAMQEDIAVLRQRSDSTQQNMNAMREDIAVLRQRSDSTQQNMNAMREDIAVLRQRSDSLEGTVIVAMREGFDSLRNYIDDLNYDLANNERKQRRLGRRVARLERKDEED